DREPHRAESAGRDVTVAGIVRIELGHPQLVLTHIGDDGAIGPAHVTNAGKDAFGRQLPAIALIARPGEGENLVVPGVTATGGHERRQATREIPGIADQSQCNGDVFPDLRGIELDVNDPGAGSESSRVASHPVVEAESDADDEVGVLDRAVDVYFAVHARHAQMQAMTLGKCADTE